MIKPILYYLVGLPASGKTTWAEQNKKDNSIIHISSDNIREELYGDVNNQDHNNEVFQYMDKKTKELLRQGKDVIYDATNINSKRRNNFLKELNKIDCEKICIYFYSSPFHSICMDMSRDRKVGKDVICKMYKNLQIPMYHEGWDNIIIKGIDRYGIDNHNYLNDIFDFNNYDEYEYFLSNYNDLSSCINFSQDNPHHTLSLSRHMYYTYEYLKNKTNNKYLKIASILHDIGKVDCKEFKGRYAHYYGHENISAQKAINFLMVNTRFSENEIIKIAMYVQLHMRLLNLQDSYKAKEKFIKLIGDEMYNDLLLFHNADMLAK